jgi:hypothetical protein
MIRTRFPFLLAWTCLALSTTGCGDADAGDEKTDAHTLAETSSVITFDLDQINRDGLIGPPDGLRSVMYEFCIPADSASVAEVRAIDPSLELYPASPGRVTCSDAQILCIGTTHQADWRTILERLASLDYVTRIDETFWE